MCRSNRDLLTLVEVCCRSNRDLLTRGEVRCQSSNDVLTQAEVSINQSIIYSMNITQTKYETIVRNL